MASNILSIAQSGLAAAQAGLSTTGHNIANASTPGYSRQVVVQGSSLAQNFGAGFIGQGTEVQTIKRIYNDYLGTQVQSAQTSKSGLDSYYAQIRQIDNMLADPVAGLAPVMQDFFASFHELSANPTSMPARQAALSSAESLASRFQGMASRLREVQQGVNNEVVTSVNLINTYAQQIAQLNDAIGRALRATGQPPNDLLDQRDQLILDLNKEIKATVVKQGDDGYNVFIGNGQPLVVGLKASQVVPVTSPANPTNIEVGFRAADGSTVVPDTAGFVGGRLGGLLTYRRESLEPAQNALGQIGIALASEVNAQHQLGFDLNGSAGTPFFSLGAPTVYKHASNTSDAVVGATIADSRALTASDYTLRYDGTEYTLTRLSDNTTTVFTGLPQNIDGLDIDLASGGPVAAGDSFLIRPTMNGASGFGVAITDPAKLAASATGAVGDSGNALLLAGLQTGNLMNNGTTSFQGAYGQLVSQVGNKTRELEVTSTAAGSLLTESTQALQAESGVNLDEEATNLLRYQQAYQAAAKVMDIASQMFEMLLTIGR